MKLLKKPGAFVLAAALITCFAAVPAFAKPNFKGTSIIIGNWWENYDAKNPSANTTPPKTQIDDNTLDWRVSIQKKYKMNIVEKNIASWDNFQQSLVLGIMTGKPPADIFTMQPDWMTALYQQNLLYPISDCTSVDFTKPLDDGTLWNQAAAQMATFNGKTYGVSLGVGQSQHTMGIWYNKRLFTEAGLDPNAPYDLQKEGKWTWDALIGMCKKLTRDTDNDGVTDVYAFATDMSIDIAAVESNDAHYVIKDPKTGLWANGTSDPKFLKALQWVKSINDNGYMMPRPSDSANWDWFQSAFRQGKGAMLVYPEYFCTSLANMQDDWGFVLFPKGPDAKDYIAAEDPIFYSIPAGATAKQANAALFAYAQWNTAAPKNRKDPDAWKDALYPNYRDARAVDETLAMIRDAKYSRILNYRFIPGLEIGDINYHNLTTLGAGADEAADPAQLIESVQQSWDATIAKANQTKK
jgi:ABC-type glycerol-3-phosphate transport system substrate-binding protein